MKKVKKNEGEVPQYYVEGHYDAIIDPETFELVQAEMERRSRNKHRYSGVSMFSSKIKCGVCTRTPELRSTRMSSRSGMTGCGLD